MKVITLGGGFIADHLPYEKINPVREITYLGLCNILNYENPDVVVNCLGATGRPNVDWCEGHRLETYQANVMLPLMIANWCEENGVHMIHIGSGCIYFGESPNHHYDCTSKEAIYQFMTGDAPDIGWRETDFANPQSYYSKTKYACDLVLGQLSHVSTLRIRMPISELDAPRNLINKLRAYSQVIDIHNSMTFMTDLTRCVEWFTWQRLAGIYHVANPGSLTAAQIMREYQKYVPSHTFEAITESQLDRLTTAKRSNCILNTDKLQHAGFIMTPAEEALQRCMQNYIGRQHVE